MMQTYLNGSPPGHSILIIEKDLFVPLKKTTLTGTIIPPLADLYLEQEFLFTKKEHDKTIEAVYRFPLPGDAAIKDVEVEFGSRVIRTTLKKRKKAEKEYKEAKEDGKQAALISRESPNVFTLKVAGIHPDELVKVKTHYIQILQPSLVGYSFRLPLTTAPRYVRDDEFGSRHAEGNPLSVVRDPKHRFSMELQLFDVKKTKSSTHEFDQKGNTLEIDTIVPNKDLVLEFELERKEKPSLSVIPYADSDYLYFLVLVKPPTTSNKTKKLSFVEAIDHSGSMGHPSRDGSKWSISDFVARMTYLDVKDLASAVHVCVFDTRIWWEEINKQKDLDDFLNANHGGGGTHLGVAIEQCIHKHKKNGSVPYNVIITDAQVSDYGRLFRLANQMRELKQRFIMICVDTAPNAYIPLEMARRAGGMSFFLSSSAEGDMINAVETISRYWKEPLGNVRVKVETSQNPPVEHSQGLHEGSYLDLGDLLKDMSRWAVGRIKIQKNASIKFSLLVDDNEMEHVEVKPKNINKFVKDIFGIHRVNYLESLINARYDFDKLNELLTSIGYNVPLKANGDMVYSDNILKLTRDNLDALLAEVALEFGLASKETSFIAITKEEGKVVETFVVPNALPENWDLDLSKSRNVLPMASPPSGPPSRDMRHPKKAMFMSKTMKDAHTGGGNIDSYGKVKGKKTIFEGKTTKGIFFESKEKVRITAIEVKGTVAPGAKLFFYKKGQSTPVVTIDLHRVSLLGGKRPLSFDGYARLECNMNGIKLIIT